MYLDVSICCHLLIIKKFKKIKNKKKIQKKIIWAFGYQSTAFDGSKKECKIIKYIKKEAR